LMDKLKLYCCLFTNRYVCCIFLIKTYVASLQFKKDKDDDDPNGNDSNSASRGNWWQGRTILVAY